MNDLFEVKRYWTDSNSINEAVDHKEASTKQEIDILKRLKLKASIQKPIEKDAKEQERHSPVVPTQEVEKNENEEANSEVKRKKKRKKTRKLKDQEEDSEKRGGFPVLGDNKLQPLVSTWWQHVVATTDTLVCIVFPQCIVA